MSDRPSRVGYPDVEDIGDGQYYLTIPLPSDPDRTDLDGRGPAHNGGTITITLTENQVNEWINKMSQTLAESSDE